MAERPGQHEHKHHSEILARLQFWDLSFSLQSPTAAELHCRYPASWPSARGKLETGRFDWPASWAGGHCH